MRLSPNTGCPHTEFYFQFWDCNIPIDLARRKGGWGEGGMGCQKHHNLNNTRVLRMEVDGTKSNDPNQLLIHYPTEPSVKLQLTLQGGNGSRDRVIKKRFDFDVQGFGEGGETKDMEVTYQLISMRAAVHDL